VPPRAKALFVNFITALRWKIKKNIRKKLAFLAQMLLSLHRF
jgi:hypothetical protein